MNCEIREREGREENSKEGRGKVKSLCVLGCSGCFVEEEGEEGGVRDW